MTDVSQIKYWVLDVDGTMTDGSVYYDEHGNELKRFNTRDAAGFFTAHAAGMKIIIITGRECAATTRRMEEMKVDYLYQKIKDKYNFLKDFMQENGITKEQLGYIGDDLNDLKAMEFAGYVACPADACDEIKARADYVSIYNGGYGAVRDGIANVLKLRGIWEECVEKAYQVGI